MTESDAIAATTVFAKTTLGQEEIQHRGLRLPLLTRRLLVLVDGKRSLEELGAFVPGQDVQLLIQELVELNCVEAVAQAAPKTVVPRKPEAPVPAADSGPLAGLPPPAARSAQQVDMARNFMINTINTMLEQNSRLTLVKQIFDSQDAAELRTHFEAWEAAISSSWTGKRRLDELRKKLFAVL
jgi:hypothetical protein